VRREQRLVRRHHRFALRERRQHHGFGNARAADEFDDHVDLRIIDDLLPIRCHQCGSDGIRTRFVERLHGDLAEIQFHAEARGHEVAILLPRVKHATADRAATQHPKVYLLHRPDSLPGSVVPDNAILESE
jgi:hypothetical protein